jgi:Xaa-Pro dipeptidase
VTPSPQTLADRRVRYEELLAAARAGALILTSEPGVLHACGVRLYTQRLIPQRPVAWILTRGRAPVLLCCALEEEQLAAEHPELELAVFPEFGTDPWRTVARLVGDARDVVVEDTMPAAWADALRVHLGSPRVRVSAELPMRARQIKDDEEQLLLAEVSEAAERALAAGAVGIAPDVSESVVADRILSRFAELLPGRTSELLAMVVAPPNNRSMHHLAGRDLFGETGPVRLGLVGRVDGYWMIITRMLALGSDRSFEDDYRRYLAVYEGTLDELRAGAPCGDLYERCAQRAREWGFSLETLKIGHGTGLDFRERPWIAPGVDDVLEPGMVLAYDYGLDGTGGTLLHVEDRVLVTDDMPRRLSPLWQLDELIDGYVRAL